MARQRGPVTSAVALALLLGAVGCGAIDPKQSPVDADAADFCKAYARLAGADQQTSSDDMHDYIQELARFGTPRGIPTAARNAFEYVIDSENDLTDGAAFAALPARTDLVGQDAAALRTYVAQVCTG